MLWDIAVQTYSSFNRIRVCFYGSGTNHCQVVSTSAVMQALKQERARRVLEGAPASVVMESEEAIVAFFIEGCRFEMQSGHTERAIASIQAALEYACLAPSFPVGMLCLCCGMLCCERPALVGCHCLF